MNDERKRKKKEVSMRRTTVPPTPPLVLFLFLSHRHFHRYLVRVSVGRIQLHGAVVQTPIRLSGSVFVVPVSDDEEFKSGSFVSIERTTPPPSPVTDNN